MKHAWQQGSIAVLFGTALFGFGSQAVSTVIPPPAAMAAPVAQALASGAVAAGIAPAEVLPPANTAAPEDKTSAPPSASAWKTASVLTPQRVAGKHSAACRVLQLGQWYNVRCAGLATSAITQLAGEELGVHFSLDPAADDGFPREGEVTFALRDAQSRAFSFWTFGEGYDGPLTVMAAVVVQARRHAGVTSVLIHDAFNQPIRTAQSEIRRAERAAAPDPTPRKTDNP